MGILKNVEGIGDVIKNADVFVCNCMEDVDLKDLKAHWKLYSAGFQLDSKFRNYDFRCIKCSRVVSIFAETV